MQTGLGEVALDIDLRVIAAGAAQVDVAFLLHVHTGVVIVHVVAHIGGAEAELCPAPGIAEQEGHFRFEITVGFCKVQHCVAGTGAGVLTLGQIRAADDLCAVHGCQLPVRGELLRGADHVVPVAGYGQVVGMECRKGSLGIEIVDEGNGFRCGFFSRDADGEDAQEHSQCEHNAKELFDACHTFTHLIMI